MKKSSTTPGDLSYAADAQRPLSSLVFLLPLILAYEVGLFLVGPRAPLGPQDRVIAYHLMQMFFRLFGVTGFFLPGFLIIVILLSTHLVSRQPWTVRWNTIVGMLGESLVWTLPLFVFNRSIRFSAAAPRSDWLESVVVSTGAGVYEELIFRLILITAAMILLEDVLHLSKRYAVVLAVAGSAILFSLHHHQPLGSEPFALGPFAFRTVAGAYLGVLFLCRGYGITAGCHALYNIIVVTLSAMLA